LVGGGDTGRKGVKMWGGKKKTKGNFKIGGKRKRAWKATVPGDALGGSLKEKG